MKLIGEIKNDLYYLTGAQSQTKTELEVEIKCPLGLSCYLECAQKAEGSMRLMQ